MSKTGPCYGERGCLTEAGGKVQCHLCGGFFHHLGYHVVKTHEFTADEYCDEFGLMRTTGLISPALAKIRSRQCTFPSATSEVKAKRQLLAQAARRKNTRENPVSLQERRKSDYYEQRSKALAAAREACAAKIARAKADGTYQPTPFPYSKENHIKGQATKRARDEADPSRRERRNKAIGDAHLIPTERLCIMCGAVFVTGATKGRRKTCGESCLNEYRRQRAAAMRSPAAIQKRADVAKARVITRDARGRIVAWVRS